MSAKDQKETFIPANPSLIVPDPETMDKLLRQGAIPLGQSPAKQKRPPLQYYVKLMLDRDRVLVEFNQDIAWLTMTPDGAREMAKQLRQAANAIEKNAREARKQAKSSQTKTRAPK